MQKWQRSLSFCCSLNLPNKLGIIHSEYEQQWSFIIFLIADVMLGSLLLIGSQSQTSGSAVVGDFRSYKLWPRPHPSSQPLWHDSPRHWRLHWCRHLRHHRHSCSRRWPRSVRIQLYRTLLYLVVSPSSNLLVFLYWCWPWKSKQIPKRY